MSWTCDQVEARLSDYLEGLLQDDERRAFDLHAKSCPECTPLLASVQSLMSEMRSMPMVEPPPRLIYSILDQTLGPRETVSGWQGLKNFLRGLGSPKFAYGTASVLATLVILVGASGFSLKKPKLADLRPATLTNNLVRKAHLGYANTVRYVSDLRVVYEIQSRLHNDENNLQTPPEESLPKTVPEKAPGQSDDHKPAPKQQNRANQIGRQLEMLAAECPVTIERSFR